jgi:hypothetical protein
MKKAVLLSILVVVVQLTVGVIAHAQQPTKVPRIGFLCTADYSLMSLLAASAECCSRGK